MDTLTRDLAHLWTAKNSVMDYELAKEETLFVSDLEDERKKKV